MLLPTFNHARDARGQACFCEARGCTRVAANTEQMMGASFDGFHHGIANDDDAA